MEKITSSEHFQSCIGGDRTVVKCVTTWCPDCRRMDQFIGPIIDDHHLDHWYEVDVDQLKDIAVQYDVMGVPSLLVFENGEKIGHLHSANAKTPDDVQAFLSDF